MAEQRKLEFVLIRYAPDAITDEFATIGVLLFGADGDAYGDVRFTRDWRRVRCLDPGADLELLAALEADLRAQFTRGPLDRATLLSKLQDYCSNGLRFTAARACLAEDPQAEMETLARMYLERKVAATRERSARSAVFGAMRNAFEQAGVWGLMLKKIPAADYTHRGDPLKLDCGYKINAAALPSAVPDRRQPAAGNRLRLFHAVSLAGDVDAAKVLAFSFPEMREGIRRVQGLAAQLTAITESGLDTSDPAVAFALATLERSDIAVAAAGELPRLAEQARRELEI